MHEVVQGLSIRCRHDRPQFDERLVMLARQEQADEILPQGRALLLAREQVVKHGTKLVNRLRGGCGRLALGRHGIAPSPRWGLACKPANLLPPAKRRTIHTQT